MWHAGKWKAVVTEIKRMNKTGRPVLVGTTSVEKSETLAARLKEAGIACQVCPLLLPIAFAPCISGVSLHFAIALLHAMSGVSLLLPMACPMQRPCFSRCCCVLICSYCPAPCLDLSRQRLESLLKQCLVFSTCAYQMYSWDQLICVMSVM